MKTIGGSLPRRLKATASGAITAGKPVIVDTDGTVSDVAVSSITQLVGSAATFESASTVYTASAYDSNAQKVVIIYRDGGNSDYGTAVVGTVSDMSISFGTPVVFVSASIKKGPAIAYDSDEQKVVIAYGKDSGSPANGCLVGTVSGTSISFGSEASIFHSGLPAEMFSAVYDSNTQQVILVYDYGTTYYYQVGSVSGTSITFGSYTSFHTSNSNQLAAVYDPDAQRFLVMYRDAGNSNYGTVEVGTVSGTSISFGTPVVFESATTNNIAGAYDANAQKVVLTYKDGGNSDYGTAIVGTVSGTSISFGTPVVFASDSGTFQYQTSRFSTVYDSNAQKVVIAYRTYNDSDNPSFVIAGTVSGTSISFETAVSLHSNQVVDEYIVAVYDSNSKRVVVAVTDSGDSDYGKGIVYRTASSSTNLTSENYIGIAEYAAADTETATVLIKGGVSTTQSSLTPGQTYFVQTDGTLGLTAGTPSVTAGTAVTSTKLIVKG